MKVFRALLLSAMLALGSISLSACGGRDFSVTGTVSPGTVQTLQQAAFAARTTYAVALRTANEYAALPRCGGTAQLCSKQSIVDLLRSYDIAADKATSSAVEYARSTSPNELVLAKVVEGAQKAVATFNAIASTAKGGA